MENSKIIGERLKKCRKDKKLSQNVIAELLNVQRQVISYFETGTRTPGIFDLVKLAEFFNVSTDYLLGLTDVATTDADIKTTCEYTGLTQEAVACLRDIKLVDVEHGAGFCAALSEFIEQKDC